jgi:hypothetical protein
MEKTALIPLFWLRFVVLAQNKTGLTGLIADNPYEDG